MRKQILSLLLAVFVMAGAAFAQDGQRQQMTPEERITATMEKLAPLNLTAEQQEKTKVVISDFFNESQKSMQEMRANGNMDREAFAVKRKELADARDAKLKTIFTADQMKKWIDEIEPSLRPQRRPGGN